MARTNTPSHSERVKTDESLGVERRKTDAEISKRSRANDERSDEVMERARERADAVLEGARERADSAFQREEASPLERQALENERKQQDEVVARERKAADEVLALERGDRERLLRTLLGFEREQTDDQLLIERERGDAALHARDDFMTMVSHDVRTLLGGITMGAATQIKLAGNDANGKATAETARKIQRLSARIGRLVGDLVDVASIEGGRFEVTPRPGDVRVLVTEAIEAFQPIAAARELKLHVNWPSASVSAMFDSDRVLQVLANLLSNACKFTPPGGAVTVSVEQKPEVVQISVTDSGPGIPEAHLESIFERFWQVTKGDRRGLGLGLFISRCIVEAHHGRIWASSRLGVGSTLTFTLPTGARN